MNNSIDLHAIVETVYPGAVADWALARRGQFTAGSFESTMARQVGEFRALQGLTRHDQQGIVNQVCASCIREPSWFSGKTGDIPCAEPCNFWLSAALEKKQPKAQTDG